MRLRAGFGFAGMVFAAVFVASTSLRQAAAQGPVTRACSMNNLVKVTFDPKHGFHSNSRMEF